MAAEPLLDVVADRTLVPRRSSSFFFRLLALQSLAFFFTFAAFNAAQSLAGSIPAPPGLAPIQFMAIYVTFSLLCIPAPKLLSHIGPKACMILGMSPYAALVASFLAPHVCTDDTAGGACWSAGAIWALRLTTAVLLGMGAPILWTGQGVYLGRLAAHEARRVSKGLGEEEVARETSLTLKRYNGVFWSVFQLSGAAGLVSSSLVLSLVQSTSAITYLFLGLSACCAAGLVLVVTSLPALPPAAPAEQPEPTGEPGAAVPAAEREGGGDGGGSGGGGGGDVTVLATLRLCADPRMLYLVPNILYNGLSLAYTWYMYNTFVFGTSLGTSFVGFGGAPAHLPTCPPAPCAPTLYRAVALCVHAAPLSYCPGALGYLVNALATSVLSRAASRFGQAPTMALATAAQAALWATLLCYSVKPIGCAGCAAGTAGSCLNGTASAAGAPHCLPYTIAGAQQCGEGLRQCEWLHGDAVPPAGGDVALVLLGICVFHLGDAVWESQLPAVLQTLFDQHSGQQPAAMANLKLWQSLGISAMFGLAQLNSLRLCAALLLATLLLSSASLLWAHTRVANLDSGARLGLGGAPAASARWSADRREEMERAQVGRRREDSTSQQQHTDPPNYG